MPDFSEATRISASGLRAQASRLRLVSENIANADTPGFRRKLASFETVMDRGRATGEIAMGAVALDRAELNRIHDPFHPLADQNGYYDGSNVNLIVEIADAREAQRSYEANLRLFDQARKMRSSLFDLLRK